MALNPHYTGREQTFIKHKFLTQYLEAAAFKVLQGRSSTFNFVDAFAGPWRISDTNEYSDTSFAQAIHTLEAVRQTLKSKGHMDLKVRFCLCEKNSEAHNKLLEFVRNKPEIETHVFRGAFEDNLSGIRAASPDGFTFTFIDPTGWNIRSGSVFEFLREMNGEFLLNFMAEDVNRHAEYEAVAASFGRFLADPGWADEYALLPEELSIEQRVLHLLKINMKRAKVATYLPDIAILKPDENRIKMRLILGTHSRTGVTVFRDVQEKIERAEIETRSASRADRTGQPSLFPNSQLIEMAQGAWGVGCQRYIQEGRNAILRLLKSKSPRTFETLAALVQEDVPTRTTQVNKLLSEMRAHGEVKFALHGRARVPKGKTLIGLG